MIIIYQLYLFIFIPFINLKIMLYDYTVSHNNLYPLKASNYDTLSLLYIAS